MKKRFIFAALIGAVLFLACPTSESPIPDPDLTVTIDPGIQGGTVTANPAKGPEGTEISLTVQAKADYKYKSGSLQFSDGTTINDTGAQPYTFILAKSVTITAQFEKLAADEFSVTIDPAIKNGTVIADPQFGKQGTEITLTVTADKGYTLDSLTYTPAGGSTISITAYKFSLSDKNVTVTASFKKAANAQALIDEGTNALVNGNFDAAISAFDAAWELDKGDKAAIVYSSLAKLASIATDQKVRNFMQNHLGINGYPGAINKLLSPDWMEPQFLGLDVPGWIKDTNAYKGTLDQNSLKTSSTYNLLLFANLLDKNTSGLNSLLDDLISSVFGDTFNAAVNRAASLQIGDYAEVSEDILDALGISDIIEGDGIYIGKAELNLLFSAMRIVKASLEWVAAYDWNTDLNFLKKEAVWNDLTEIKETGNKPASLPLRNNFLKARNNSMMVNSKADFIKAIDEAIAAYDYYLTSSSRIPQAAMDALQEYQWVKDGFSKLKVAINGNSVFYVKESSGNSYSNTESNAIVGINMGKLFNPGQFSIDKMVATTGSGSNTKLKFYDGAEGKNISSKNDINKYDVIWICIKNTPFTEVIVYPNIGNEDTYLPLPSEMAEVLWDLYN